MAKWSEFGEQVNRLTYTLAGCKFHGNVDSANRFLAERIHYSEASVRAMRQGRFRPQDDRALETLVEIGAIEAGLGREWACRLLFQGQHPNPKFALERIFPSTPGQPVACPPATRSPLDRFALRMLTGSIGGLLALALWAFAISRFYPAPHELPVLLEAVWGLLVGSGLAAGIAAADALSEPDKTHPLARFVSGYLPLPLSGMAGAVLWNVLAAPLFHAASAPGIGSTWAETLVYGAVYGLSFGLGTIFARGRSAAQLRLQPVMMLFFVAIVAVFAAGGFLLATAQPAFANQKDIDLVVGLLFRTGLLLPVAAFFPPLGLSELKPAA